MAPQDYLTAVRSRIDEIDGLLSDRDQLVEERELLWAVVRFKEPAGKTGPHLEASHRLRRGDDLFTDPGISKEDMDASTVLAGTFKQQSSAVKAESLQKRSKTEQVLEIAVSHVRQVGGQSSFNDFFKVVPPDIIGVGRFAREHVRSIIQRAGERVGLSYDSGTITFQPQ